MPTRSLSLPALALVLAGAWMSPALAQDHAAGSHGSMGHDKTEGGETTGSEATDGYRASNMAMHSEMDIEFTGDADVDFARGMIAHHKGAIEMARIVLEHGDDAEIRQAAEQIIAAQEEEMVFFETWLAENAGDR